MITLDAGEYRPDVPVPEEFIRTYLPVSPGEYVKVYLYLLMLLQQKEAEITVKSLAKALSCTEDDIMESLRFWKGRELLELIVRNDILTGIRFRRPEPKKSAGNVSAGQIRTLKKENKDAAQLIFVSEQYLKRPLSRNDINVLLFFLEDLKMPLDVCEFVVEYCVLKGHTNIRYIEKVGLAWHDKGIRSVKEAREQSGMWNKYHYDVLKAFGVKGRDPVPDEVAYIEKWRREYGFSMPIIQEACGRTVAATGKASFKYADSILKNWHDADVHDFKDIEKLDKIHNSRRSRNAGQPGEGNSGSPGAESGAARREYDFQKIAEDRKRLDEAYASFPRLSEIDAEVSELSMRKARINLGLTDADDFDLEKRLTALAEERMALLLRAGYTAEEISDGT